MATFNTQYLSSNRGIIKIVEIIIGFVISSLLCGNWHSESACFGQSRLGFPSALNIVVLIINIVLLVLNCLNLPMNQAEGIYSMVVCVLFFIATLLVLWHIVAGTAYGTDISASALLGVQFALFFWDVKIIRGEAAN